MHVHVSSRPLLLGDGPSQSGLLTNFRLFQGRCISGIVGEGNAIPLQYSSLENPMDGGGWWAAVHGVAQSQT